MTTVPLVVKVCKRENCVDCTVIQCHVQCVCVCLCLQIPQCIHMYYIHMCINIMLQVFYTTAKKIVYIVYTRHLLLQGSAGRHGEEEGAAPMPAVCVCVCVCVCFKVKFVQH